MKYLAAPLALVVIGLAAIGCLQFFKTEALSEMVANFLIFGGIPAYLFGSLWTVRNIGRYFTAANLRDKIALTMLAAFLSLPQILLGIWFLAVVEDVAWMVAPIALPPGMVALPLFVVTIYRLWFRQLGESKTS